MTLPCLERLRPLGLNDLHHAALSELLAAFPGGYPARVIETHRETVRLHDGDDELRARRQPALVRALADDPLAVGDWALLTDDGLGGLWVQARTEPATRLARRDGDGLRHALVNNVDTALVAMGLDGDFNPRRAERFVALAQAAGIEPVVVLTKADLCEPERVRERASMLVRRWSGALAVIPLDTRAAVANALLAPWTRPGRTLVLLGTSGTGKSTLTNTLLGVAVQDTGPVRAADARGRHTTTSRSLHPLPGGACLIDTPGVRTLGLEGDETMLQASFADIATAAAGCRFRDCRHQDEPGCAVREAVDADRLRNYRKLARELARDQLTPLQRQRQRATWKARSRAGEQRARMKRGLA